ncbi:MAG: DUF4124 domain-containing protein [Alcanivorax jadensis]|uniref:DUF4124 domain-containing protein n=1 Tax=Alcanivorax jadensis TaxID=64988 RepID=UPI003001B625
MNKFSLLLGSLLLILASASSAAKFYKWVDDQGVTHYGANPPQGTASSEVNTRANASSDQDRALESLQEKRDKAEKEREKAEKAAEESRREKTEPDAVQQERCGQYRKNLDILINKPTVRQENPETGEMEVIDQDKREAILEKTRKALEQCEAS